MKTITLTKPVITDMARRLSSFMRDKQHVEMKHSHALDAVSAILGWRSRQAMSAELASNSSADTEEKDNRLTVFILYISHRHGHDISAHASEEDARETLAGFVSDWWDEIQYLMKEPVAFSDLQRDAAIDLYFDLREDEYFELTQESLKLQPTD